MKSIINSLASRRGLRTLAAVLVAVAVAASAAPALAARPCPPDTNCSGSVDVDDLIAVILQWGQSGTPADINGSGVVDVDDLIAVILNWGACVFQYPPPFSNAEAHQIGLEMLGAIGPLLLSQTLYDRIDRDLTLIRAFEPNLAPETHSMAWAPNQFIIGLVSGQPLNQLPCLNTYYQATMTPLGQSLRLITTAGKINVPAICAIYDVAPEVSFAEPDGLIGGQNFWTPTNMGNGTWRWSIDDGFLDCFDGCDCHRYYVIDVNAAGNVTLISYQEIGQSWCKF